MKLCPETVHSERILVSCFVSCFGNYEMKCCIETGLRASTIIYVSLAYSQLSKILLGGKREGACLNFERLALARFPVLCRARHYQQTRKALNKGLV